MWRKFIFSGSFVRYTQTETMPPDALSALPSPARAFPKTELVLAALTLLAASVPYLVGVWQTPPGHVFTGFTYNMDDCAVYLAWMRQAARGEFFQRNPFTTDPETPVLFNAFFLLLGNLARVTHAPLIAVYHAARVGFGGLFLLSVFWLIREAITDVRARTVAFALVCFASGFGWMLGGYDPGRAYNQPVDLWQPEAIAFLSLYYTPLFAAALACVACFAASVIRAEKTNRLRDVLPACLMGFLLGNFHSYDIIPLFLAWGTYRVFSDLLTQKLSGPGWARLLLAGICTLPTVAYQLYAVQADPVFRARALVSQTLSPPVYWILLGFGLPLVLAVCAPLLPRVRAAFMDKSALQFLCVWAIVGIVSAYLPFAFQRKLIMGAFVPLCVLGGAALAQITGRLSGSFPRLAVFFAVFVAALSNGLWIMQDVSRLGANVGSTARRPYLTRDEWNTLQWLHNNTKASDAVLVGPDAASQKRFPFFALEAHLAPYVPAFAGNRVYNGHWSETPNYPEKQKNAVRFFSAAAADEARRDFLTQNNIRYVLYPNALGNEPLTDPTTGTVFFVPVSWPARDVPAFLSVAYQNQEITLYAVQP